MAITKTEREQLKEWVALAFQEGYTLKQTKEGFKKFPRDARLFVLKEYQALKRADKKTLKKVEGKLKNIDKLKGGFDKKMPKEELYNEEEDEFNDVDFEDDEEEVVEEKPKPKRKVARQPKVNPAWFVAAEPEKFRVIDPIKKTVILESNNAADLSIQLQVKILQMLEEKL